MLGSNRTIGVDKVDLSAAETIRSATAHSISFLAEHPPSWAHPKFHSNTFVLLWTIINFTVHTEMLGLLRFSEARDFNNNHGIHRGMVSVKYTNVLLGTAWSTCPNCDCLLGKMDV